MQAYRQMWRAFSAAGRTSDVDSPDLARYADGDALRVLRAGLAANRREGLVSQGGEVVLNPHVMSMSPSERPTDVQIRDCADTSKALRVKVSPGATPFTDAPGGRRLVDAAARQLADGWKVVSFTVHEVGSC